MPLSSVQDPPEVSDQSDRSEDRHSSQFMIRLPEAFRTQLKVVQSIHDEEHGYKPNLTDLVKRALREFFVSQGVEPPPK